MAFQTRFLFFGAIVETRKMELNTFRRREVEIPLYPDNVFNVAEMAFK
ncbi:hypothetical protein HYZ82_03025 [Candidatus Nomurabacteria bacterium]|nr:hypothetical protein [Candidatus Nomurabacteria bacterium]